MQKNNFLPFIKVCGIQTLEDALLCLDAGANTLGFLVGLTHLAEDKICSEQAGPIIAQIKDRARTVMVTHLTDPDEVTKIAKKIGVSTIQIHDDMPVEAIKILRETLPGLTLIKAVHVIGNDALQKARLFEDSVDFILLDSRTKDRLGGTGVTHDWNISRQIVLQSKLPVILAGGLNPSNIDAAIESVKPAGIDANSGLENREGRKDFQKVAAFVKAGLNVL